MPLADSLAAWHDFYMLLGGACATLVGLVFVAVTLNIERFRAGDEKGTLALAERTFGYYLILIVLSLVVLIPTVTEQSLAVTLASVGLLGMWRVVQRLARGDLGHGRAARRGVLLPAAGFLLFLGAAVMAVRGVVQAFSLMAFAAFLVLVQSVLESWRLLLMFRHDKTGQPPGKDEL